MRTLNRRTATRVKDGRVQKKNNWSETASYYNLPLQTPVIDRKRPGEGYRHLLKQRDLHEFIRILPDWTELSKGLNAVVLAPGEWDTDGYYGYSPGVVHISAWVQELWTEHTLSHFEQHRDIYERLEVPFEFRRDSALVKWREPAAVAYQLLHIFLHELGHHHDRMTSGRQWTIGRGEPYAEAYARRYEAMIWDRYLQTFDLY